MLLKFIIAVVVLLLILNVLAFVRRRVGAIQDEVFQATYHSIEDAHRKGKADLSEEASKIEGFFGEQAYGSSKKIPKSQQDKVKKTVNKLKDEQRNQKQTSTAAKGSAKKLVGETFHPCFKQKNSSIESLPLITEIPTISHAI